MRQLRELLKIRDFRHLWGAQVASDFGDNLTALSLLLMIQRGNGSPAAIAGLMIAITLPALVFGLLSGVYVDRFDRRRTMIISDFIRGALVLMFLVVDPSQSLWPIYAIAFAQASIGTLFGPARSAMTPRIVGEDNLLAANSVTQTSRIIFNLLGTTAAGILASVGSSFAPAFIVDSMTFMLSALLITRIRTSGEPEKVSTSAVWTDMRSGFGVMARSRALQGMLVGAAVAMFGLGAVNVLSVPYIVGELGISEAYFGLIEFAQVLAMVVAGSVVAVLARRLDASNLLSMGLAGVGVAVAGVSLATEVWQLLVALFLVGLFVAPTQAGVTTLSQSLIPDEMRGRVGGALSAVVSGANVASMGLAGVAAAALGLRTVFVVSGAVCLVAGGLSWLLLRGAETEEEETEPPSAESVPLGLDDSL